ncbi:hypothetical protein NP493_33g07003 [Ridgeia piscesae]|uniref:Uncharacterized protein n=1 Tax=Ridgeia piscesae TaxID=27915 RepID=A0AAD9UJZ8_RIDPI|nr:hypothetical protein NP493_33g07003 [Ridgeia piscesae]
MFYNVVLIFLLASIGYSEAACARPECVSVCWDEFLKCIKKADPCPVSAAIDPDKRCIEEFSTCYDRCLKHE